LNHNTMTDKEFLSNLEQFKYFGTTPTNQNYIQEEIKIRFK